MIAERLTVRNFDRSISNSFSPNRYDPASIPAHVAGACATTDGAVFVTKLLHPPTDVRPQGIPDGGEGDRAVVDQRREITIDLDSFATNGLGPPPAEYNLDVLCWTPPGNNTMVVYAVGLAGVDFRKAVLNNDVLKPLASGEVRVQSIPYEQNTADGLIATRGCCDSFTDNAGPPATNSDSSHLAASTQCPDCGEATEKPGELAPAAPPSSRLFGSSINSARFQSFRTMASSITGYYNAPMTSSQGMWHVWNGGSRNENIRPFETALNSLTADAATQPSSVPASAPYNSPTVYEAVSPTGFRVPFDEGMFSRLRQNPYIAKAKDGFYSIHRPESDEFPERYRESDYETVDTIPRPVDATFPWVRWGVSNYIQRDSTSTDLASFPCSTPLCSVPLNYTQQTLSASFNGHPLLASNVTTLVPWLSSYFVSPFGSDVGVYGTNFVPDLAFDDWTQTVAILRGASHLGTITVKRCLTLEVVLTSDSPLASQLGRPPLIDPQAMATALRYSRLAPSILPAKDNNFASVFKHILKAIKGVVPVAAPILAGIAPEFAPEILGGATVLEAAADLGGMISSRASQRRPRPKEAKKKSKQLVIVTKPSKAELAIEKRALRLASKRNASSTVSKSRRANLRR